MNIAVTDGRISQMIAARVGRGGPCSRLERRSHPWSGQGLWSWCPFWPSCTAGSSNQLTGQTVTETEIISIIYGVYSIH